MKKCPTCGKTFDDNMRFCQADGTPLEDDSAQQAGVESEEEAPFDPYATIVGVPKSSVPSTPADAPDALPPVASPAGEVVLEPVAEPGGSSSTDAGSAVGQSASSTPVAPPDNILDLGDSDPLKTMYVSDAEMKEVLGTTSQGAETPSEEIRADEAEAEAAESSTPGATDFSLISPPPSPFSEPAAPEDTPVPSPPTFLDTPASQPSSQAETQAQAAAPSEPESSFQTEQSYQDAPTLYQPHSESQLSEPMPAPIQNQEWNPPPAPDPNWQNQQIGSNTPFQPPPAGAIGQNKTLPIISLVLGIVSLCCYTGVLTGLAALVTGFLALRNIKQDPQTYGGKGLAIGGMIAGAFFVAVWIIYWIVIALLWGGMLAGGGFR